MAYTITSISNNTFSNLTHIIGADLSNMPWNGTSMQNAFYNCVNLANVQNANMNGIINMQGAFYNCTNLNQSPVIPNSVVNMYQCFYNCQNLVNAPEIPNSVETLISTFKYCSKLVNTQTILPDSVVSMRETYAECKNLIRAPQFSRNVTDLTRTFYNCSNLEIIPSTVPASVTRMDGTFEHCFKIEEAPIIPNSVTDMANCFQNCYNLTTVSTISNSVTGLSNAFLNCRNLPSVPNIPESTIFMYRTFDNCKSLTGNIYINSTQITTAMNCFENTSLIKNVYIPFIYINGVNSRTYNSFIAAGYDEVGTKDNVYLKNSSGVAQVTLTIICENPNDALIEINSPGHTTVTGIGSASITIDKNSTVSFSISKSGYTTRSETAAIPSTQTWRYSLIQTGFTLTVNPNPSDATVTLTDGDQTITGTGSQSITVVAGTDVTYTVSKTGYTSKTNTVEISADQTLNVSLISNVCTLTVIPVPSSAGVGIQDTTTGSYVSGTGTTSLTATLGDSIHVVVTATGYTTKTVDLVMSGDATIQVSLEVNMSTITFTTNAPNPSIVLTSPGYVQVGNSITVPTGTRVDYNISADGYVTRHSTIYADGDKTYNIILSEDGEMATITISAYPKSSSISMSATGYDSVSGNGILSMTVVKGTHVGYTVTYGSQTISLPESSGFPVTNDVLIEYDMTREHVRHSVGYTAQGSSEHLIGTFIYRSEEGTMVVGPVDATAEQIPLFYPKGVQVMTIFTTENGSHTSGYTATYNTGGATGYVVRINKILTVNYTPTDAMVTAVDGAGNVLPPITESAGQNTYYLPYYHASSTDFYSNRTIVTVSRPGYESKSTTVTRVYNSDSSITVNLTPES